MKKIEKSIVGIKSVYTFDPVKQTKQLENMTNKEIKSICKFNKEVFVCNHELGFISSKKVDVKAGMRVDAVTGKIDQIKIRKVGTKTVYFLNKIHEDGDVQLFGQFTNLEQAKKVNK